MYTCGLGKNGLKQVLGTKRYVFLSAHAWYVSLRFCIFLVPLRKFVETHQAFFFFFFKEQAPFCSENQHCPIVVDEKDECLSIQIAI